MTAKEQVIDLVRHLPDDVGVEEIIACLAAVPAVLEADQEIGDGEQHGEVMARMRTRYA